MNASRLLTILFLCAISITACSADGMYVSDYHKHLSEPDQKAVITWDGKTETMILASSVSASEMANFAWITPILSNSQPKVTESNISVFYALAEFFDPIRKHDLQRAEMTMGGRGVVVLEVKEIGVYDITILKAETSSDLINWLKENDYIVPSGAKGIFDEYCGKGDAYFVINKLDFRNKYAAAMEFADDLRPVLNDPEGTYGNNGHISDKAGCIDLYGENCGLTTIKNSWMKTLAGNIMCGTKYEDYTNTQYFYPSQPEAHLTLISKEKYEALLDKYSLSLSDKECKLLSYNFVLFDGFLGKFKEVNQYCFDENNKVVPVYGPEIANCAECKTEPENCVCNQKCDDLFSIYSGTAVNIGELQDFLKENLPRVKESYENIYQEIDSSLDPRIDTDLIYDLGALYSVKRDLINGLSTPLKFTFEPDVPYYPLQISSLSDGSGLIDIYVFSKAPVSDVNKVLNVTESKEISSELRSKIGSYVDLTNANYVTRLTYQGDMDKLYKDAEFEGPGSAGHRAPLLSSIWGWIAGLFG